MFRKLADLLGTLCFPLLRRAAKLRWMKEKKILGALSVSRAQLPIFCGVRALRNQTRKNF
jgi:hypothetical protein